MLKKYITYLLLLVCWNASGQDIHFSHLSGAPLYHNPAFSGLFSGDLRLAGSYRSQWNSFTNGYQTIYAGADFQISRLQGGSGLSMGIQTFGDKAGDLDFRTTGGSVALAGRLALDPRKGSFISMGLQGSYIQQSVDYSKIVAFDNEPNLPEADAGLRRALDLSAGLVIVFNIQKNKFYSGLAYHHFTRPVLTFYEDNIPLPLYGKIQLQAGGEISSGRQTAWVPQIQFSAQGPIRSTFAGTFFKYILSKKRNEPERAIYFGGWVRWYSGNGQFINLDAWVPGIRFDIDDFNIIASYDVNVSPLRRVSRGGGGPEISLVKVFSFSRKRRHRIECPVF